MAYASNFEYDVFISYAHADNESGWVNDLHKTLTSRIDQYLGSRGRLRVWFDQRRLLGNEVFDDSIRSACRSSALLVCVVSPSYLNSSWCEKERATFLQSRDYRAIGANPHATRIFKVLPLPVSPEDQPDPLSRLLGYSYFEEEPQNRNWTNQFFLRNSLDLDQRFFNQTDKIAKKVSDSLKDIMSVPIPPPPGPSGPAVYVAECTDDVEDDRYLLAKELGQFKVPTVPGETPLPIDNYARLEEAIQEALGRSLLSVHILGTPYGKRLATDPEPQKRSVPHIQYQLAVRAGKPRIVWLSSAIDEAALRPEQAEFLRMIKQDEAAGTGSEYLRGSLETLKTFVKSRVLPPVVADSDLPTPNAPVVFVSAHANDFSRSEVKKILDCCASHGCEGYRSALGDDPVEREKRDVTYMRQAQGLVILYAGADPDWVRDRVWKVRQKSLGRKKNPLVAAVVDAPPPPENKLRAEDLFSVPSVTILRADREIDCELLRPFFNQLRARRSR